MKLAFIDICGFRGYQKRVRIDFSDSFTIIDGRNGVGKSTLFDAVEFALTGSISKYLDAKADGESVEDYLWWSGDGDPPKDRYVEVGFREGEDVCSVRRTPLEANAVGESNVVSRLLDQSTAPTTGISQLCAASIIRDEHIARLSLDLKEGDRFSLLRDAIGAVDAEVWIKKASSLASAAGNRVKSSILEVEQANVALANSVRQIDQARSALPTSSVLSLSASRLQTNLGTTAPADQLGDIARHKLAEIASRIGLVKSLLTDKPKIDLARDNIRQLYEVVVNATGVTAAAEEDLRNRLLAVADTQVSTSLSRQARDLEGLVNLGRSIGLRDGHCPLCASDITLEQFSTGLDAALSLARHLDAQAVDQASKERDRDDAKRRVQEAVSMRVEAVRTHERALAEVAGFDARLEGANLSGTSFDELVKCVSDLEGEQLAISADLRLIDTISLDRVLARASEDQGVAKERVARAESRLGRARLAEARSKAIHDAVRRAAAETLDQRLERVLPLMSELYKRLRPHPVWSDIEYSVRGDVKRFLKLQVGDGINPQFVFSSGQRRATGLAFLLSINLSIAWSRWHSILLDDPVQHVDDFRTLHLAEVLTQLCEGGRQIICAVEDSALADLMCRRLPASSFGGGKRITLSNDQDGALSIGRDEQIARLNHRSLVSPKQSMSA